MDVSLYTDGEQATAAVLNRPIKEIKNRLNGDEARNGNIYLSNCNFNNIVSNNKTGVYNEEFKGTLYTGGKSLHFDNTKIPIDPNKEYTIRIKLRKLTNVDSSNDNNDRFYAGVKCFDENGEFLSSDEATSYNYGVASNKTQKPNNNYTYTATFKGFNLPDEASPNKFDPGATHFSPMMLVNHSSENDSRTVIQSLEVKISDYFDQQQFAKEGGYAPFANHQTFYVGGDHDKFYPVLIPINNTFGGPRQFSISRAYSNSAPQEWNNSTSHKGGLELIWEDVSTTYSANMHQNRIVRHWATYTRIFAGMQKVGAGAGYTIMYLRGGNAYYQLGSDHKYINGYGKMPLEDIVAFQDWITTTEEGTEDSNATRYVINDKHKIVVFDNPTEVQSTDENGDPIEDENGDPVMEASFAPMVRQYYRPGTDSKWNYKTDIKSYFTLSEVNAATELLVGDSYMQDLKNNGYDSETEEGIGLYLKKSYYGSSYTLGGAR